MKQKAFTHFRNGRMAEAKKLLLKVCKAHPNDAEVWYVRGMVHANLGEFNDAESSFARVVALQPHLHEAHNYLGLARVFQGRLDAALQSFQKVIELRPDFAPGYANLGSVWRDLGDYHAAVDCYRQALSRQPGNARTLADLGGVLVFTGQNDEAMDCYRQALQAEPDNSGALIGQASLFDKTGEPEQAWQTVQSLIQRGVEDPFLLVLYSKLCPKHDCVADAARRLEAAIAGSGCTPNQRVQLGFALARLYDRSGDYEKAFAVVDMANSQAHYGFDMDRHRQLFAAIAATFAESGSGSDGACGSASSKPVFIVGMPRSGTSLVEQILASHPQVYAGGERETILQMAQGLPARIGMDVPWPQCMPHVGAGHLRAMAEQYLSEVAAQSADAALITDKTPTNYLYIGLIERLFPNARIIHCRRDARDTCLSCYFQNFGGSNAYIYDLDHLGQTWRLYDGLMTHWHAVSRLPILDVVYEDMVADLETGVRRLLDFCGLPWDPGCLAFNESRRVVDTSSYEQVRRPLYSSSVGRWRHYEAQLEPLFESLARG